MRPFRDTSRDRYKIWNTITDNLVQTEFTSEDAIRACRILNEHNVGWNKSFPRCIVIDSTTGEKFYSDLEYMV